ncbi:hypothetical protein NDI54_00165 [Haloarcula sp. S1AR25-5A]|uniref:Lipoprotein n=1 Tax=Haloarcula terrestris TaxID=2950533 RepID=A0AAE4ETH9_9EURY|nr:hypothetical protein [Haloarcula terrestris]MDS0219765.1 hypothetical protein [Haloarcula terrestris]
MPSRRTVLAVACTLVAGCSGPSDDPSEGATTTATPAPVVLSPVDAAAVPETATAGVVSEAAEELEAATRDASGGQMSHEWAHVLREFDCFAFDGTTYAVVERTSGSGGYVKQYSVTEIDGPRNKSAVRVGDLPDSDRRAVTDAIASGKHRYDSDEGGFEPTNSVYVYNGSYYAFTLEVTGDKPIVVRYAVEETDDNWCVALEPLPVDDTQVETLDTALRSDGERAVTGTLARTLADSGVGFVLRDGSCYELSVPADRTGS